MTLHTYTHRVEENTPQDLDLREDREFYVTVRDGQRHGLLLGPFPTHLQAIENIDRGRELSLKADAWASFYSFGTASAPKGTPIPIRFPDGENP